MIYVTTKAGKADIFSTIDRNLINLENIEIDRGNKSQKNYVLCFTERSGSTMLCSLLLQTNVMGSPEEYLNSREFMKPFIEKYPCSNLLEYFDLLRCHQVSDNRVFGIKTNYIDFEVVVKNKLVGDLLAPVKFIYLTRQDILLQAISSYIARKSGKWHDFVDRASENPSNDEVFLETTSHISLEIFQGRWNSFVKPANSNLIGSMTNEDIPFDEESILNIANNLARERANWELFFSLYSIEPLRITYEEVLKNTELSLQNIANFLDIKLENFVDLNMSKTRKLGNKINQEWADRIRDDRRLLSF